jgi:phosphoserine phosphatase
MEQRIKLIFFDMEGTLFSKTAQDSQGNTAPSAWTLIAKHLGKKAYAEEEETKRKWTDGEYAGYVEWMEDTLRIHKKYGLTKEFFENVMESIEYHPGVKEVFDELHKRGIRTALISGGFKEQANRAQRDLKISHAFAACEYLWADDGTIHHFNLLPCDYEGKVDFMQLIMKEHGLKPEDCAFVGDGRNDVPFAKAVGTSIAFNGSQELQNASTYAINQDKGKEDFKEILQFI